MQMKQTIKKVCAGLMVFTCLTACGSKEGKVAKSVSPPSFETRIINADKEPQNWLSTGRNYAETRFSPLQSITTANVAELGLQWSYDLDTNNGQEATPIVVDGVIYISSAWSKVQAFDAKSGKLLWQFDPEVPKSTLVKTCCDAVNRGVAYWQGNVYVGTLDGRLIAIDAVTGKQVWSTLTVDPEMNYTITGAPRIGQGLVFIGNGGGEFGVRGYVSAYDVNTGEMKWRFYTVPGEPGKKDNAASDEAFEKIAGDSWSGDWWNESGGYGGGTVWDSLTYDPELKMLYIGVGNASYWNKKYRSNDELDNLFVSSILALDAKTGKYVWHYQQTPGDAWDYTSTQHMILTDLDIKGEIRKVLMQAPKNGFFYILDRQTGELLSAENFVPVNWTTGIDKQTGRPNIVDKAYYWKNDTSWVATPGPLGAHNWHPMSYSQDTGLVYIPAQEAGAIYTTLKDFKPKKVGMNLSVDMRSLILPDDMNVVEAVKKQLKGYLLAWDPVKQEEVWRAEHGGPWNGGVLSTAGNLVFQGDVDGAFNAYNAKTGELVWSFESGNMISAAPATYSVDGVQYITVLSGFGTAWSKLGGIFAWDDIGPVQNKSRVLTFTLGGNKKLAVTKRIIRPQITPPEQFGTPEMVVLGEGLYHLSCFNCHGVAAIAESFTPPDLRYSPMIGNEAAWTAVVHDGILASRGMVSFNANFNAKEIEAIRAYVISRSQATLGHQ